MNKIFTQISCKDIRYQIKELVGTNDLKCSRKLSYLNFINKFIVTLLE